MRKKTIIITGASDGIGAASARQLTAQGERVVLIGRNRERTAALARELGTPHHLADFSELAEVRRLAAELREAYPQIDVLANNAGGIMGERQVTEDGFEKTFQVNHLAPFLLTSLLLPTLLESRARVIQTASIAAKRYGRLDLTDLQNEQHYSANRAYGNAKLANILFTNELQRRYGPQGICAVSFHPGNVATSFASETNSFFRFIYHTPLKNLILVPPEKGGAYLTWLIQGTPGVTWVPGGYYENNKLAFKKSTPQATDVELAKGLWEQSARLLKL